MAKISKEKARSLIVGSKNEPSIDPENYNLSLANALNYYNNTLSLSDYKNSALDFADSIGKDVARAIPEFEFRGIGAVCRLILREEPVKVEHIQQVVDKLSKIQDTYLSRKQPVEVPVAVPVVEVKKENPQLVDFLASIEDVVDSIILTTKYEVNLDEITKQFTKAEFSKSESKAIIVFIDKKSREYGRVVLEFTDEQYKEAYQNVPVSRIKKVIKFLTELSDYVTKILSESKKAVTISKKKDKPALVQVKNIEYCLEWDGIKGLHPKEAIGASEIWLFDTETRDLSVLRVETGLKIAAEGASFRNIDADKSIKKKLRKPEDVLNSFLNGVDSKTKKAFKEIFDQIKTTESKTSGRMNDKRLILHVFK